MAEDFALLRPAFFVEKSASDPVESTAALALTCRDGREFLRGVVAEAKQYDNVVTASNASALHKLRSSFSHHTDRTKALNVPEKFIPNKEWQDKQVSDFSSLRTKLDRHAALLQKELEEDDKKTKTKKPKFPGKFDGKGWCVYLYGAEMWNEVLAAKKSSSTKAASESDEDEEEETEADVTDSNRDGQAPLISFVMHLRQVNVVRLLELHAEWAEHLGGITPTMGMWIYALLARVEKPLHPDVASAMRTLALISSRQRASVVNAEPTDLDILPTLSLLICIVARYFGQGDLADQK